MTPTIACPERSDLLALAAGDAHSPALKSHVESCRACRKIVRRLEAEIRCIRSNLAPAPWFPDAVMGRRARLGDS